MKECVPFIDFLEKYVALSEKAKNAIIQLALTEHLPKGSILNKEGKTCKRIYFLKSGAIRTYFYKNGKDITHWIYPNDNLVTSWHSYLSQTPAKDYLETTEASELISLSQIEWQQLYARYPELESFGRLYLEEQMALIDDFYKGYYFLTAKEKYQLLTSAIPKITQMANLGHIASMLGISQETLSRIRQ